MDKNKSIVCVVEALYAIMLNMREDKFDLIKALKSYKPFNEQEKHNVDRFLKFLKTNQNCFVRTNMKGHVTAGGFVADGKGNILLNHHKKSGMWFQFGGHSDGERDSLKVARREVMEESGIFECELISDKIFDVDVQKIPSNETKNEGEHLHYDVNFLFYVKSKAFEISNESTEIKWVSCDEARVLINDKDFGMKRMIDKYEKLCK